MSALGERGRSKTVQRDQLPEGVGIGSTVIAVCNGARIKATVVKSGKQCFLRTVTG